MGEKESTENVLLDVEIYEGVVNITDIINSGLSFDRSYKDFKSRNMLTYHDFITAHKRLCDIVERYQKHIEAEIVVLRNIEKSIQFADQQAAKNMNTLNS